MDHLVGGHYRRAGGVGTRESRGRKPPGTAAEECGEAEQFAAGHGEAFPRPRGGCCRVVGLRRVGTANLFAVVGGATLRAAGRSLPVVVGREFGCSAPDQFVSVIDGRVEVRRGAPPAA